MAPEGLRLEGFFLSPRSTQRGFGPRVADGVSVLVSGACVRGVVVGVCSGRS